MTRHALNPYDRERQLVWRNRVASWRAHPDEAWFHGIALTAAATVATYLLTQALPSISTLLRHAIGQWPVPLLVCALVIIHLQHTEALRACRNRLLAHWLAAQPIAASINRRMLRRVQLSALLSYAFGGGAVLHLLGQPGISLGIWLAGCTVAIATARLYRVERASGTHSAERRLPFAITASGSFWRWQWIEACAVLAPRRLAGALWLLLLAPAGHWSALLIALVLVLLYLLLSAWNRSIAVLPAAERWLASQPLRPSRWLRACLPVPLLILAASASLLTTVLAATASLHLAPVLLIGLTSLSLLHFACAAAERRRAHGLKLGFTLHLMVLLAILQSMPLLLAPVWIVQMSWLIRRSLRS